MPSTPTSRRSSRKRSSASISHGNGADEPLPQRERISLDVDDFASEKDAEEEPDSGMNEEGTKQGEDLVDTSEECSKKDDMSESSTIDDVVFEISKALEALDRKLSSHVANIDHNLTTQAAQAGIIQKVYCENFMDHCKLGVSVDLGPHINFVHGNNSRETAILAALQVCLGTNASGRFRGQTFHMESSDAKIRVTLLNRGRGAYQHDVYGDIITVERTISDVPGSSDSGLRLLDQNLVEQSRDEADLSDLLKAFNIQVENPVAILDGGEVTKLVAACAKHNYKFFMEAAQVDKASRAFQAAQVRIHEMEEASYRGKEELPSGMDQVDALRKTWKSYQRLGTLDIKYLQSCADFAWACFAEYDNLYAANVSERQDAKQQIEKKEAELREAEAALNHLEEGAFRKHNHMEDLVSAMQQQLERKGKLDQDMKAVMKPYEQAVQKLGAAQQERTETSMRLLRAKKRLVDDGVTVVTQAAQAVQETEAALEKHLIDEQTYAAEASSHINSVKNKLDEWSAENAAAMKRVQVAETKVAQFLAMQAGKNKEIDKRRRALMLHKEAVAILQQQINVIGGDRDKALRKARILQFRHAQLARAKAVVSCQGEVSPDEANVEPTEEDLEAIEPVAVCFDMKHYEIRMNRLKAEMQQERACRRSHSQEEVTAAFESYIKAKDDLMNKITKVEENDAKIDSMSKEQARHGKQWRKLQKKLSARVVERFDALLSSAQYSGTLDFHHKMSKLDVNVRRAGSEEVEPMSGELRALAAMALWFALGEVLDTPIRIVNDCNVLLNKTTVNVLLQMAATLNHRQIIIVASEHVSCPKGCDHVRVVERL